MKFLKFLALLPILSLSGMDVSSGSNTDQPNQEVVPLKKLCALKLIELKRPLDPKFNIFDFFTPINEGIRYNEYKSNYRDRIYDAIAGNNKKELKQIFTTLTGLINPNKTIISKPNGRYTPLLWAVHLNEPDMIKELITEYGANPDKSNKKAPAPCFRTPPLILATSKKHVPCIKTLLAFGADVNKTDLDGKVALHYAHGQITKLLLDNGANPNAQEQVNGHTPLHIKASKGDTVAVKLLLQAGATTTRDRYGKGPEDYASGEIKKLLPSSKCTVQ